MSCNEYFTDTRGGQCDRRSPPRRAGFGLCGSLNDDNEKSGGGQPRVSVPPEGDGTTREECGADARGTTAPREVWPAARVGCKAEKLEELLLAGDKLQRRIQCGINPL